MTAKMVLTCRDSQSRLCICMAHKQACVFPRRIDAHVTRELNGCDTQQLGSTKDGKFQMSQKNRGKKHELLFFNRAHICKTIKIIELPELNSTKPDCDSCIFCDLSHEEA